MRTDKKNKKFKVNIYIILCVYFILIGIVAILTKSDNIKFSVGKIESINNCWEIKNKDGNTEELTLPAKIDEEAGNTINIKKILPKEFLNSQTIRIRLSMQYIKIMLDNKVIYDNTDDEKLSFPFGCEASMWIFIDIPSNSEGKELDIQLKSNVLSMSGRINAVAYGSKGDLIWQLIKSQWVSILLSFFVLIIAIFTFVGSFLIKMPNENRLRYLCIFALSTAIWLLSELDIFQLFSGSKFVVGSISYLMLPIASIAMINYLRITVLYNYAKELNILSKLILCYLLFGSILQVFFSIHYIRSWIIFIGILIFAVVFLFVLLIKEVKAKNRMALKYILFLSVLLVSTTAEIIMFITGFFMNVSKLSIIGIVLFLVLLLIDLLNYLSKMFKKQGETKYLREVAYRDALTGGYNRAAFEKDVDKLLSSKERKSFRVTMFDLNKLKQINDYQGHSIGDQALIEFLKVIESVYNKDLDKCYRVGGDEFMVIEYNISDELHQLNLKQLQETIDNVNSDPIFNLSTAIGSDVYYFNNSFGEFKHELDKKMYENKRKYEK